MSKFGNMTKDIYPGTILELATKDSRVIAMDADLGKAVGSDAIVKVRPDIHFEMGIAEQDMVATAGGLSEFGKIPFATTFSGFMTQRAADQMNNICYNKFNVKMIGSYAGLSSEKNGGTHICVEDVAITRCMPNLTVLVPGDAQDVEESIRLAYEIEGPVYIRLAKGPFKPLVGKKPLELGKGQILREGKDLAILSMGITTAECMEAAETLAAKGIEATVVHMPSIKPFDTELVLSLAAKGMTIYTVENHSINGGLGSLVAETVSESCPTKVIRIGMKDVYGETAKLKWLMNKHGITAEKIAERIAEYYV